MIIIRPVEVTDAVLTFSDVPETDAAEYSDVTTYGLGAVAMRTTAGVHSVYESLQAGNTGNLPELDDLVAPVWWARVSATNRWAMFSNQINDQTEQADEINVTLAPGALVNGAGFFNLDAQSVRIRQDDPVEGVVKDTTYSLIDDSGVNNWYAWYFEPIVRQRTLAVLDLLPYASANILITITNTGSTAKLGRVTIGAQRLFGDTDLGTSVGLTDYSRKERDTFGNPVIVERNYAKRADYIITVPTGYVSAVLQTLADYRTRPMCWIGSADYPSTIVFGYYNDFEIGLSNHVKSLLNITVEGLT